MAKKRTLWQLAWAALSNGYALGFTQKTIFKGWSKHICAPGLNCYSCPGALMSCPIGALQAVVGSRKYSFSFFAVGFLLCVGSVLGRFVCGWLCPFGLAQDLLYKIPLPRKWKRKNLPGHKALVWLKYVVLLLTLTLPALLTNVAGQGAPQFCKWLCPSGTLLGGWPLMALDERLRGSAGALFLLKSGICLGILLLATVTARPFCKYLCPLGAAYSPFNKISLVRLTVDADKCTRCGACAKACDMGVAPYLTPDSLECIRCGDCRHACPHAAIKLGFAARAKTDGVKKGVSS